MMDPSHDELQRDRDRNRDRLVAEHLDLVERLAWTLKRKLPPEADIDDLIGYGSIGLVQAAERFDPELGFKFATFAGPRILGEMKSNIARMTWLPRRRRSDEAAGGEAAIALAEAREEDARRAATATASAAGADAGEAKPSSEAEPKPTAAGAAHIASRTAVIRLLAVREEEAGGLDEAGVSREEEPAAGAQAAERTALVQAAIDSLPDEDRALITAIFIEERMGKDLAVELGCDPGTVARRKQRALKSLRKRLSVLEEDRARDPSEPAGSARP